MADLKQFQTRGKFLMLALDHRGSFVKLLNSTDPAKVTDQEIIYTKRQIIETLYTDISSILIDSHEGLTAYGDRKKPYLLCIEKSGYEQVGADRVTSLEYEVITLKNKGAKGIKLLLYIHPQAKSLRQQIQTAKKVFKDCQTNKLPLFLEIVTYPIEGTNNHKPELVLESVNAFLENNIVADVFKIEYPGDPAACWQITKRLKKIPWILLTKGDKFIKFSQSLKIAMAHGAQGFLAGRALWQDFSRFEKNKRPDFFDTVVKQRFQIIKKIVLDSDYQNYN
jgi:tagatose-1,6-bisphosphate aldolase